jgi:holo-[acyl-carrier protein] synthase
MALRVGIDLLSVEEVREAIAAHDRRYLDRIYTSAELHDCDSDPQRLAARFAAKEATIKALRPGTEAVPWRDIEVRRHPEGWTDLELHGAAAELARRQGVTDTAVSLTHDGDRASAVVVVEVGSGCRQA